MDIWSGGGYPGEALSNLCSNAFVYDGVHCNSRDSCSPSSMTNGKRLFHTRGKRNPFETILTEQELCCILTALRDGADRAKYGDGVQNQCSRRNCPFRKWC